jgi:hypothetical protein
MRQITASTKAPRFIKNPIAELFYPPSRQFPRAQVHWRDFQTGINPFFEYIDWVETRIRAEQFDFAEAARLLRLDTATIHDGQVADAFRTMWPQFPDSQPRGHLTDGSGLTIGIDGPAFPTDIQGNELRGLDEEVAIREDEEARRRQEQEREERLQEEQDEEERIAMALWEQERELEEAEYEDRIRARREEEEERAEEQRREDEGRGRPYND